VFPDVKSATQSLQDYIASQVQARALNADGTVNLNALQGVTRQYEPVLNKLPFAQLRQKFSDVRSAQQTVDQLQARQSLYDTFANGLGTLERDLQNNPVYSTAKFDGFVRANQPELVRAYGTDGANTINQINKQLVDMAQVAQSKVKGQSGTSQSLRIGGGKTNVLAVLLGGEGVGAGLALYAGNELMSSLGAGAVFAGTSYFLKNRLDKFNAAVDEVTRKALADPVLAKSLLSDYNPKLPSKAGTRAMNYVRERLSGALAPTSTP
jgi:hypothetical protein